MKEIAAFIKKEFLHIFRDVRTMMIVLVLPVVQILLFGFAMSTEVNNAVVDILGDVNDPQVRMIVQRIDNNPYLETGAYLSTEAEMDARLRKGKSKAVVCFERNFNQKSEKDGNAAIKVICDGSDPNTAQMVGNYIQGVVNEDIDSGASVQAVQMMYNPDMNSSYNFVPGVMGLILMLICSMMTAVSIVREKEFGTLELVLVSPVKPFWIIISKLIPYLVLSVVNFASIILLARFVMGVPIRGSLALVSVSSLLFVGASLGLGLLISTISRTQQTAMLLCGMGLTMPTMMLAGIIFPCESMPVALQLISDIIPAKWYIIIIKRIMIQGAGFAAIAKEFIILAGMMILLLWFSIKRFKTRLQ